MIIHVYTHRNMYMWTVHNKCRLKNNAEQIKYKIQCMEENIILKTKQTQIIIQTNNLIKENVTNIITN